MSSDVLSELEACSRSRPDRLLRLRGTLPGPHGAEPLELLVFRGFSSSLSHPTAFDPDQSALPAGARLLDAELLQAPLNPEAEVRLAGPGPVEAYRDPRAWEGQPG